MKEEPIIQCDGTIIFPWATFFANGFVHTWDNNGVGGENWNANDYPDENKYIQALARTSYKNPAPFLAGEKCYLREGWTPYDYSISSVVVCYKDLYDENADGTAGDQGATRPFPADEDTIEWFARKIEEWEVSGEKWLSPILMPAKYARRFFVVVSCVPVRVSEVDKLDAAVSLDVPACIGLSICGGGCKTCASADPIAYFVQEWNRLHPGKEWTWRIEIREEK
jgi:hypothetical protein